MHPLVSIVIPCYKGERFLAEAIESCLAQSWPSLEIIVVDDASPDQCGAIAERYARKDPRVRAIRLAQNGGVSRAFNVGFDAAKGEFMTRLAQDDLFLPNAISTMAKRLIDHPEVGLVYCDEQQIDEHGKVIGSLPRPEPAIALANGNKVGLCVMWRRAVWEKVGKFNPEFDTAEDYDYWLRVREHFVLSKCAAGPQLAMRRHSEMGSKVYSGKQEVLAAKIQAAQSGCVFAARQILKRGYFDAAYNYQMQGRRRTALKHIVLAIFFWPFDLKLYRLLVSILLRSKR